MGYILNLFISFHHLIKGYKLHISKFFCRIYTAFGEAEQLTFFNKYIKDGYVNLFVSPFELAKITKLLLAFPIISI